MNSVLIFSIKGQAKTSFLLILTELMRTKSMRQRVAQFSTAMESIQAPFETLDTEDGEIP
jgi:hypothetical protein